jgi:transcription initiation factor TFIIF subunit beta
MEKGALFDEISKCFEQFKYWSLKALRNKLKQPEAYIKEALDEVAVLIRSGDFAMNYKLKPEYEKSQIANQDAVKDEIAPSMKSEDDTDQATGDELVSDDDDVMDFEDVKIENTG